MRYRVLGGTGIEVSAYCLGTMMFGYIGNPDHEDCARIIHSALDRGVNFVDTADMYSGGESEEIVGKALKGRREDVVLATKVHFGVGEGPLSEAPNRRGNSRRWIVAEVENSLRRLGTDWIDLYQIHRPDPTTDIEETLSALTDLQRQGKIRAFGSSTFPADLMVEAQAVSDRRALGRFRSEQPPYSILNRGIESAVLPTAQKYGMGTLVWSPLAFGFLTGKYRKGQAVDLADGRAAIRPSRFDPSLPENAAKYDAVEELVVLAEELGCTLPQLAIAFTQAHPGVTSTILGPRTMEQLDGLLAGAGLVLDDAVLDRIDAIVAPGKNLWDTDWPRPALTDPRLRRRHVEERTAG
ncbi:aldo/keto reductase [Phytomonospora sp. NPDC050363]|uniref:aldo/keto reductase n=1 Tax=Phytomonospora sp. NPDC050363 TaxID=3155642 RepID=UPI0033FF194D